MTTAKKTIKPKPKSGLTVRQLIELAERLDGTRGHVYYLAGTLFKKTVGEEIFEDLKVHGELFKCELCDRWRDLSMLDPDLNDYCAECVIEMNLSEDDDANP